MFGEKPGYGPSRELKSEKLEKGPYLSLVKRIDAGLIPNLWLAWAEEGPTARLGR